MKIIALKKMTDIQLQMTIKAKSMNVAGLQRMLQDESIPKHILASFWETLQYETKMLEGLKQRAEEATK